MGNVAVSLISDGSFRNVVIPKELLSTLVEKLREEGECPVHLARESIMVEGIIVLAKGSKSKVMLIPND